MKANYSVNLVRNKINYAIPLLTKTKILKYLYFSKKLYKICSIKGKNAIVTPLINKLADASFLKIFNLII